MRTVLVVALALALAACDPLPAAKADPVSSAVIAWPAPAQGSAEGHVHEYH